MESLDALFDNIPSLQMELPARSVLIYGAGNSGNAIAPFLENSGIEVSAFVDQNAQPGKTLRGRPVLTLQEAFSQYGGAVPVLMAIHNRVVDMVKVIQTIRQAGFDQIFNMFHYVSQFPQDETFRFFLTNPQSLKNEVDSAKKFFNALEDDKSKALFLSILKFRLSGNYQFSPQPEMQFQYAPKDIPPWTYPMRLIDCGAYDGDSIKSLSEYGYELEEVIALEPDEENYSRLCANVSHIHGIFLPCGASSVSKKLHFNAGNGEASRVVEGGGQFVQMLSIDEAFPDWAPTFIKMDIEGGEGDALLGASKTIAKYRPGLALSAYHLPTDLWRLGVMIHSMELDYRFYLRSHGYSSFETVLYAVPK